jgi:DNA-binding GntR family transcriptional regulator
VDTRPLSEQILDALLTGILRGDLAPGRRLSIAGLAREFGTSTTPVKDALRMLVAQGLVVMKPRTGTFIAEIDAKSVGDTAEIRKLIETYAVDRVVDFSAPEVLERMRRIIEECEILLGDAVSLSYAEFLSRDADFHSAMVESLGNDRLTEMYRMTRVFFDLPRVRRVQDVDLLRRAHEEHKQILKACQEKNKATLKASIARHIDRAESDVLSLLAESRSNPSLTT